jgi:hypothetical protein
MRTYFVRHSSALDVDKQTLQKLWDGDLIGIHYPHDDSGESPGEDSYSLDPKDYEGRARSNLARLKKIGRDGGYIFGAYRGHEGGKIGYVEPGTEVELFAGKWGNKNGLEGRNARLKVLKVSQVRNLDAFQSLSLTSVQPRQGTLCEWKKVGGRVESLVSGVLNSVVGSLTPDLQEVMCMEFMKTERAAKLGLPQILHTLAPVGRTLKDLDILAIGQNLEPVSVQVTYHHISKSAAQSKLSKLTPYLKNGGKTILFCNCEAVETVNGHMIFPLKLVFEEFCINTVSGAAWYKIVSGA